MGIHISRKGAKAQRKRLKLFSAPLRFCGILLLFLACAQVPAQQRAPVKEKESEKARRAKAVALIVETADAARAFKDLFYRARLQTLAADALWPHDATTARAIFRRAWEAATAYDKAEQEAEERETGVTSTLPVLEARDEVLAKAAARDAELAELFLRDLLPEKNEEQSEEQKSSQPTNRRTTWRELSEAGAQRLALAYALLNAGEAVAAAHIATPLVAEGACADLITFILLLHEHDSEEASALYARLIRRMSTDAGADANDVLLLTAPVVSPKLLVVVDNQGGLQFRTVPASSPTFVPLFLGTSPEEERLLYITSASILLRPSLGATSTPEAVALYVAIERLLPFFQGRAPQYVANLRLRSRTLMNEIEAGRREALTSQLALQSLTAKRPGDPLRAQTDQLGRARDAQDRDRIALGIVRKAAQQRLWDRARRAAAEIEDTNLRRVALSYIAVSQVADLLRTFNEDKENDFESMARFVRKADVPLVAGAWGLAQAAFIATQKGDKASAAALLDEAQAYAARTPAGTWQRVAAYTAIARLAARISETKRFWELAPEVVRAANALEDYAGDEDTIEIALDESHADAAEAFEALGIEDEVFRLDHFFATMARLDEEKALTTARTLGSERARAFAMLAIAKVMLNTEARSQEPEKKRYPPFILKPGF
jgi:hypothetical protein